MIFSKIFATIFVSSPKPADFQGLSAFVHCSSEVPAICCKSGPGGPAPNPHRAFHSCPAALQQHQLITQQSSVILKYTGMQKYLKKCGDN
ncbi:MAG TPA: hypothetical protein DEU93_01270 [Chitinophagaceae bacterium]|nr:hypothetical protein [Chitinophagaceae bacterium]